VSRAGAARRLLWLGLACGTALGGTALRAEAGLQSQPHERTGPESAPPERPPFADPGQVPDPLAPAVPADSLPAPVSYPAVAVREVRVSADAEATGAVPPLAWTPPSDEASGIVLEHAAGQPLDADWVRAQFERNMDSAGGTVARAVAVTQLVNRAYLTAGFFNSGLVVPQQTELASGILDLHLVFGRLVPIEGSPDSIAVEWGGGRSAGLTADYVRRRFGSTRRRPLSAYQIEREFRLLADDPAVATVNADLRPGVRPGEASLRLTVVPERRFDVYVGAANDRSPSVGGERLYGGGLIRSLIAAGDELSGEFGVTDGLEDGQLGYTVPFLPRVFLAFRGSFNNAAVIDRPLLPLDISAKDRSVQGGFNYRFLEEPLMPTASPDRWSPSRLLSAGLLVAHRWQRSFLFGQPFSFAPGSIDGRTEYTALRFTGDYLMRNVDQVLAVSFTATYGLGGTQSDIPAIPNPDDHFKALLLQVNYAKRLGATGLEMRLRLTGQVADGILYSGERLSIGGENSVRGYRENLFLADNAVSGSVELAYPFSLSPRAGRSGPVDWGAFTASVFADGAVFEALETPDLEHRIASVGVALTWNPSDAILARVSYGEDLREVPISGTRDLQDRGFQFRIVVHPLRLFGW